MTDPNAAWFLNCSPRLHYAAPDFLWLLTMLRSGHLPMAADRPREPVFHRVGALIAW